MYPPKHKKNGGVSFVYPCCVGDFCTYYSDWWDLWPTDVVRYDDGVVVECGRDGVVVRKGGE